MIIAVIMKSGNRYHVSGDSLEEVRHRVESGEEVKCWWFSSEGRKNEETFLFPDDGDAVSHYASESDASPLEEM